MKAARKTRRRFRPRSERVFREGAGERLTLALTSMAHQGEALGRSAGKVVFAAYGMPEEEAVVEVREDHNTYALAEVVEVITASPHRVQPQCPHFGECGGCQLQHIAYPYQLELKRRVVEEQLRRIGKLVVPPVSPTLPCEEPWHYRNHARFTVTREGVLGFTHWHTHRFVPIDHCYIMAPWINQAKAALEGLAGGVHQTAIRYGINTGSYLIHPFLRLRSGQALTDREGTSPSTTSGQALETAQPYYEESLFGLRFRVSASSFFQVNTRQAERMAALVRERLELKGTDLLVDAYAGVGTFAALFAPFCARVVAIEESNSAIRDAHVNLRGFASVDLLEAKTEEVLAGLPQRPDAVILDPPRMGCDARVIEALVQQKPDRIVYVSCDPATLARDLNALVLGGFRLLDVTPVDMFPQTYHIECVATLERSQPGDLILASTSPRRRDLLSRLGIPFQTVVPSSEETREVRYDGGGILERPHSTEHLDAGEPLPSIPADYAIATARAKALSVAGRSRQPVLAADTIVVAPDGRILGKPADAEQAREMLNALRGRAHSVITGVVVAAPGDEKIRADALESRVLMRDYSDEEIEAYIATGEPFDKAGAYAIQDPTFHPAEAVEGCYHNVVGLPLCLTERLLRKAGLRIVWEEARTERVNRESVLSGGTDRG